jgi:hypothetical protein
VEEQQEEEVEGEGEGAEAGAGGSGRGEPTSEPTQSLAVGGLNTADGDAQKKRVRAGARPPEYMIGPTGAPRRKWQKHKDFHPPTQEELSGQVLMVGLPVARVYFPHASTGLAPLVQRI